MSYVNTILINQQYKETLETTMKYVRGAHNLKVVSANPIPTILLKSSRTMASRAFSFCALSTPASRHCHRQLPERLGDAARLWHLALTHWPAFTLTRAVAGGNDLFVVFPDDPKACASLRLPLEVLDEQLPTMQQRERMHHDHAARWEYASGMTLARYTLSPRKVRTSDHCTSAPCLSPCLARTSGMAMLPYGGTWCASRPECSSKYVPAEEIGARRRRRMTDAYVGCAAIRAAQPRQFPVRTVAVPQPRVPAQNESRPLILSELTKASFAADSQVSALAGGVDTAHSSPLLSLTRLKVGDTITAHLVQPHRERCP